jgi:hypothetical protein
MMNRRAVITGTMLAGATSALGAPAGAQTANQISDRIVEEVARAVQAVRDEIKRQYEFSDIAPVRAQTASYLRANGKFPDFIEVGTGIWQDVYDWHVRFQQPISLGRTAEGRYTILLMTTNVILRPDLAPGFVGVPFDNR